MPRCCSISIQSLRALRRPSRACTEPATWTAPEYSRNFSVSVVLPASGWEMIANVRRRRDSSTTGLAVTSFDATDSGLGGGDLLGDVAPRGEPLGAVVAGDGELHGDAQAGPLARRQLLVLEDELAGVG